MRDRNQKESGRYFDLISKQHLPGVQAYGVPLPMWIIKTMF